jgi:ribonuclease E
MSECAETYLTNQKQSNGKDSIKTNNTLDQETSLIRLVDFKQLSDDESEADDGETDDEIDEEENFTDDEDDDNVKQDEDQSSKRIRERMERTMAQMGDDNDLSTDDEDEVSQQGGSEGNDNGRNNDEEDLIDEAADELNDGFFDL